MVSKRKSSPSDIDGSNLTQDYVNNLITEDDSAEKKETQFEDDDGFLNFGFNKSLLESLKKKGYKIPTPIQKAAIPELMIGRDLLGQAQTGTGKTAAFALPIIEKLEDNNEVAAKVLVMTPTR